MVMKMANFRDLGLRPRLDALELKDQQVLRAEDLEQENLKLRRELARRSRAPERQVLVLF